MLHPNAQENDIHALLERVDWLGCADEGLKLHLYPLVRSLTFRRMRYTDSYLVLWISLCPNL